jgi:hypothetical protein
MVVWRWPVRGEALPPAAAFYSAAPGRPAGRQQQQQRLEWMMTRK